VQAAKDFALQRFAKELLDSVDNLDRALSTVPTEKLNGDNQDLVNLHSGLKMTEDILMKTLAKNGLQRFDPAENSDMFDPNRHEATFQTPQPDKKDGSVFFTQSKGFLYNGRVIRVSLPMPGLRAIMCLGVCHGWSWSRYQALVYSSPIFLPIFSTASR
jgi:molecular chaperone GrpE